MIAQRPFLRLARAACPARSCSHPSSHAFSKCLSACKFKLKTAVKAEPSCFADADDKRLTLLNSPFWTFHPTFCKGVRARWVDFRCAPPLALLTIVCLGCVGASGLFNERDDLKSPMLCCAAGRRVTTATLTAWTRFVSITFQNKI